MPGIDNRISTGNLLTILAAFASAGIAWGAAQSEIKALNSRIGQIESQLETSRSERLSALASQESRLRSVETVAARDGARLDTIIQALSRIEARLERAEGR
ncbi:hypothetical protein [Roseinatronobacter bogoriensis]|uniref:hypothetical protein n=1 Tax=Roseinatronobacter bogoriensis TaxID=119542 RepID=UPI0010652903|nr:hypothetical protein [Rhodobaca bogoriensis]MBB4207293.1 hypothetical protein [Rhodobaca bogoriensis DSM 18756]TDY65791.1 hypothetical protein EV660_11759 [Rhodobaca bogoriensis DSM 18756]